jgi:catechol 2,3-dioxygenase-like lactoylglutathione lyase family enzyme
MFDHVVFGVSDYAASKAFFLKALEPLGVAVALEGPLGVELSPPNGKASLCLFQTEEKPAHLHLAFTAENRQQVEAFYRAALEAGGKDNGAPGLRPQYHANYYAAFVIGPDGHNIEVVCHEPSPAREPGKSSATVLTTEQAADLDRRVDQFLVSVRAT